MPTTRAPIMRAVCPAVDPTRARGRRDDHGLAGTRRHQIHDADEAGEPRRAEHAERRGGRRLRCRHLAHRCAVEQGILLPTAARHQELARGESIMPARDHLGQGLAEHHIARRERRAVQGHALHDVAVVRFDREVEIAHQKLAHDGLPDGCAILREIFRRGHTLRLACEQNASIRQWLIRHAHLLDTAAAGNGRGADPRPRRSHR